MHWVQIELPAPVEYLPAKQFSQEVAPLVLVYLPGGHSDALVASLLASAEPMLAYLPATTNTH